MSRHNKTWTRAETRELVRMYHNGASHLGMAKRLGRTRKAIQQHVHSLLKSGELERRSDGFRNKHISEARKGLKHNRVDVMPPKPEQPSLDLGPKKPTERRSWLHRLLGIQDHAAEFELLRAELQAIKEQYRAHHQLLENNQRQIGQAFGIINVVKRDSQQIVDGAKDQLARQHNERLAADRHEINVRIAANELIAETIQSDQRHLSRRLDKLFGQLIDRIDKLDKLWR